MQETIELVNTNISNTQPATGRIELSKKIIIGLTPIFEFLGYYVGNRCDVFDYAKYIDYVVKFIVTRKVVNDTIDQCECRTMLANTQLFSEFEMATIESVVLNDMVDLLNGVYTTTSQIANVIGTYYEIDKMTKSLIVTIYFTIGD